MRSPTQWLADLIEPLLRRIGSSSPLNAIATSENFKGVDKKTKSLEKGFATFVNGFEIWSFVLGWIILLVGVVAFVMNITGVVPIYAVGLSGLFLMILGSLPVMTVNFCRFMFAGMKWHLLSFIPAACMFAYALQFIQTKGIADINAVQSIVMFNAFLGALWTLRWFYNFIRK